MDSLVVRRPRHPPKHALKHVIGGKDYGLGWEDAEQIGPVARPQADYSLVPEDRPVQARDGGILRPVLARLGQHLYPFQGVGGRLGDASSQPPAHHPSHHVGCGPFRPLHHGYRPSRRRRWQFRRHGLGHGSTGFPVRDFALYVKGIQLFSSESNSNWSDSNGWIQNGWQQ